MIHNHVAQRNVDLLLAIIVCQNERGDTTSPPPPFISVAIEYYTSGRYSRVISNTSKHALLCSDPHMNLSERGSGIFKVRQDDPKT